MPDYEPDLNGARGDDGLLHLWTDHGSDRGVYFKCHVFDQLNEFHSTGQARIGDREPRRLEHGVITCVRCLAHYTAWPTARPAPAMNTSDHWYKFP